MEKCSKKSKQLCLSLFKPSVMMLTTGFLCMASFQGLAAVEPSHNYGPNVESVMQNGKTVTVKVSDSMGELIGANVLVKGTTIGNVTDMNGSVTLQEFAKNADEGTLSLKNFFSSVTGAGKLTNAIKGIGLQMLTTAGQAAAIWAITEVFSRKRHSGLCQPC